MGVLVLSYNKVLAPELGPSGNRNFGGLNHDMAKNPKILKSMTSAKFTTGSSSRQSPND